MKYLPLKYLTLSSQNFPFQGITIAELDRLLVSTLKTFLLYVTDTKAKVSDLPMSSFFLPVCSVIFLSKAMRLPLVLGTLWCSAQVASGLTLKY
jgi:hypothetical protein